MVAGVGAAAWVSVELTLTATSVWRSRRVIPYANGRLRILADRFHRLWVLGQGDLEACCRNPGAWDKGAV